MPINIEEVLKQPKENKKKIADYAVKIGSYASEKAKPKDEDEGVFWKVLDVLNRGQYLSANTVENILEGDFKDIPKEALAGIRGKQKGSYIDLAQKYLPKEVPNWAKVGIGFIGDVFLDPLTYVSIGGLTKLGKAAKGTGTLAKAGDVAQDLGKLATQARAGQRALLATDTGRTLIKGEKILDVVDKVSDAIKNTEIAKDVSRLFKRTTGIPALDDMVDKYLTKRGYLQSKGVKFGNEIKEQLKKVAKDTNSKVEDIARNVIDIIEKPQTTQELVPGSRKIADTLKTKFDDLLSAEQKAGIDIIGLEESAQKAAAKIKTEPEIIQEIVYKNYPKAQADRIVQIDDYDRLSNFIKGRFNEDFKKAVKANNEIKKTAEQITGYFPRVLTPEMAEQKLKNARFGNAKIWNPKLANSLKRKTGEISLTDLNKMIRESGEKGIDIEDLKGLFMEDPAYVSTVRSLGSAKATTSAEFLDEVGKTFGRAEAEGLEQLSESLQKKIPSLKDKYFDPLVKKEVEKVYKNFFDKKQAPTILKMFDTVQNWWKAWTLSLFPSYHSRNAISNIYLNYIGDVKNPLDYARAFALQAYKQTDNPKFLKALNYTKKQADELLDTMERFGVVGEGLYAVEIPQALVSKMDNVKDIKSFLKLIGKQFTSQGMPIQTGRQLGTLIEDNARIAHYINKTRNGYVPIEAAKSVKKHLFDYTDLSAFERDVLKRIMPFYIFHRKNLPLQIESIITRPGKAAKIFKGKKAIEEIAGTSDIKIPFMSEYIKESAPVKVRRRKDGNIDIMLMENWIPVSDIMKIAEPIKTAVSMVTPIFKAPLENWANYNTFFRSEIEKFPGEKGNFFGIDFRKRAELNPLELLDVVQEKGLGEGVKSLVGIDMLRNLRILNEIDKLNPWNIFGVDRPHKVDPSQLQRWLQLFIGKLQKYDREKAFNYYNYRVNKRLGKLKGSLNKAKRENNEAEISQLTADIKNLKQELMKAKSDFERGK